MPGFRRAPKSLMAPKVMVIDFRPAAIPSSWYSSEDLSRQYINEMRQSTNDLLVYQLVATQKVTRYPVLLDGRQYNNNTWGSAQSNDSKAFRDSHGNYMLADYQRILQEFDLLNQVETQVIDEVWMFGGPYFGFYESSMVGKGAFWCNGPALERNCRRFVIMGFNYQRSLKEMVHDFGHRAESTLARQFNSQNFLQSLYSANPPAPGEMPVPKNDFERYLISKGTVHRKPGGENYGQDEISWVANLKSSWFPPVIDPNKAK